VGGASVDIVKWDDSCRVGVKELDDQHKNLFAICNRLIRLVTENRVEEIGRETIEELIDYTEKHFRREEELMDKAGYADSKAHHEEHKKMINDVLLFKSGFLARNLDESAVTQFLIAWILHHVKGVDRDYIGQMSRAGIS
jgi:hemerythrin